MKSKLPTSVVCEFEEFLELTENQLIYITGTEDIMTREDAARFVKDHVVIKKSDLDRLKKFLEYKGLKDEFEAPEIYPLKPGK